MAALRRWKSLKGGDGSVPDRRAVLLGGAVLIVLVTYALLRFLPGGKSVPVPPSAPPATDNSSRAPSPPGGARRGFVLIVDDLGHNRGAAAPFLAFDRPLALAFLPARPRTRELAEEAFARGKTVLLHLPMEPRGYPGVNPGTGSLLVTQSLQELQETLARDLAGVPHAVAVNNHEGSRATEDRRVMDALFAALRERDLFFVDSLTSNRSAAKEMARRHGVRCLGRDVFLDNDRAPSSIAARASELFRIAEARGWAVGIAHPYPETAGLLPWMKAEAERRHLEWMTLEEVASHADPGH